MLQALMLPALHGHSLSIVLIASSIGAGLQAEQGGAEGGPLAADDANFS